jgi:hypothetical protein
VKKKLADNSKGYKPLSKNDWEVDTKALADELYNDQFKKKKDRKPFTL